MPLSGMSPKYFCRFFQDMMGQTLVEYVNKYRVERACLLLNSGEKSITEVAFESGFDSLSYFIKIFKRYKGETPGQYRKV